MATLSSTLVAMSKRKPRRGRPRLAPQRKRSVRVSVMVTPDEFAALEQFAGGQGLSMSTTLHRIVVRSLRRRKAE